MSGGPGIVGVGETPALRHPEPGCDTATLIARAVRLALDDAGLRPADVDGLGLASFTLRPDRAIDMAWRL
ncbi:MAG: thiolase family protein, partial [Achromobacter sp.]|nr:thiolase family protein [Achromobacter sp.]